LINLMASIENCFGGKSKYNELRLLKSKEIKSKNVVLIIFDGMGYEFFRKYLMKSSLAPYLKGNITSVLPAGTTSAISTVYTGMLPIETGMVGWYTFLRGLGVISVGIPYQARFSKESLGEYSDINDVYSIKPLSNRIKRDSYTIMPKDLKKSSFNNSSTGKSTPLYYKSHSEMFKKILKKVRKSNKKYIYAYSPYPDKFLHGHGEGEKVLDEMKKIEKAFSKFLKKIKNTDTTIIVTADHGLKRVKKRLIKEEHPELDDCLTMPICGESGLGYCYVKSGKEKKFEKIIKTKFKNYCDIFKSEDFVKKGYFGKAKEHGEFRNRIGDYVLVFKENHGNGSKLINSSTTKNIFSHGGMTKEEMLVPLIVIKPGDLK